MFKQYTLHLIASCVLLYGIILSASGEVPFYSEKITGFFKRIAYSPDSDSRVESTPVTYPGSDPLEYRGDDWSDFVINPAYKNLAGGRGGLYRDESITIDTYGAVMFNFSYGDSFYTDDKYRQYDEDRPSSRVINRGFFPEQIIQLHVDGGAGERIKVFIDHDSSREDNIYMMQYRAASGEEILREINAGQIDIKFNDSKFAVYDNTDAKGMGVDFTLKKDKLQF